MPNIILFNKPFRVLSQFTDAEQRSTLADFIKDKGYYPAGRLDYDSEGLMLLTNDGQIQHHVANPRHKMEKVYWVQVEGIPTTEQLASLQKGVLLNDGLTKPAKVSLVNSDRAEKALWSREPAVRQRKNSPTSWLSITINEGRNRQVRRMTAAVGLPTLRLVRMAIGHWQLGDLPPGKTCKDQLNLPLAAANTATKRQRKGQATKQRTSNSTTNKARPKKSHSPQR
ncbi:MAG: pseudouridine synthase [Gammaproteobacteria bacterium]|nr:pseudouridine synthase [Gammaproteobacteria bacterium]